jgi:hypothetical protein
MINYPQSYHFGISCPGTPIIVSLYIYIHHVHSNTIVRSWEEIHMLHMDSVNALYLIFNNMCSVWIHGFSGLLHRALQR